MEPLKQRHEAYIAKLKAKGIPTLSYVVPCCGGTMENRANSSSGQWDSLATCPHCGALYMKITTADKIEALTLDDVK